MSWMTQFGQGVGAVKVGQVWASADRRDRKRRHNQHREVRVVDRVGSRVYAYLTSDSRDGLTRVRCGSRGPERHHFVSGPRPFSEHPGGNHD